MAQGLGPKIDLILVKLSNVDEKLECISSTVTKLESKLTKLQDKVENLEHDQQQTTRNVSEMESGLQFLNAQMEEKAPAIKEIKTRSEAECKELKDKLLYYEVYQRRENLRFYGIKEDQAEEEDTLQLLRNFLEEKLDMPPSSIEFQRVHRVGRMRNEGNKPRPILARFLRYPERERVFSKVTKLKGSEYGISTDLPREIVARRKAQRQALLEARRSGKQAHFSRAEPDKLFIDGVLQPM